MPNVLLIAPIPETSARNSPTYALLICLQSAGHAVARMPLEREAESLAALSGAFEGRPPDVLLVDLSATPGCLPLLHTRRLLRSVWGNDLPPPACLCLLSPAHLNQTDWTAYADDFVLPPYAPAELLSRLILLRLRRRVPADNLLRFADIVLDLDSKRALTDGGDLLALKPREYDLLEFLTTHRGKFFSRDRLLDLVWGVEFEGDARTVDIHVSRLRAKLPPDAASRLETRRGTGYGFSCGF